MVLGTCGRIFYFNSPEHFVSMRGMRARVLSAFSGQYETLRSVYPDLFYYVPIHLQPWFTPISRL